jgi:hypothetical protein
MAKRPRGSRKTGKGVSAPPARSKKPRKKAVSKASTLSGKALPGKRSGLPEKGPAKPWPWDGEIAEPSPRMAEYPPPGQVWVSQDWRGVGSMRGWAVAVEDPDPVDPIRFRDGAAFRRGDTVQALALERARRREADAEALAIMIEWVRSQGFTPEDEAETIRGVCRLMLLELEGQVLEITTLIDAKRRMAKTTGITRVGDKAARFFEDAIPLIRKDRLSQDDAARKIAERAEAATVQEPGRRRRKPLKWSSIRDLILAERRRRVKARGAKLLAEGHFREDLPALIETWAKTDPTVFPVTAKAILGDLKAKVRRSRKA